MQFEIFHCAELQAQQKVLAANSEACGCLASIGAWHWRLSTGYGELIACSGGYATRAYCEHAVARLKQTTISTPVMLVLEGEAHVIPADACESSV